MYPLALLKSEIVSGQHKRKNVWFREEEARDRRRDGRKECTVGPLVKVKENRGRAFY